MLVKLGVCGGFFFFCFTCVVAPLSVWYSHRQCLLLFNLSTAFRLLFIRRGILFAKVEILERNLQKPQHFHSFIW